jgi:uncharacterized RDD family membrane protein YckC
MSQPTPENEVTLLADDPAFQLQYEEATTTQRFLNFVIDNIFCRLALAYAMGYLVAALLVEVNPALLYDIVYEEGSAASYIFAYGIAILNWFFYYTICEKAFRGYTLGKLITGTRAIRNDGSELTFKDAMLRSLTRMVPFEPFSALSDRPWHDRWTKTTVVKARR